MTKRNDIRSKLIGLMRPMRPMRLISLIGLIGLMGLTVHAQEIVVGGNIYGGGNAGNVNGNTTVNVREGDLNQVFGGARMADVGGRSFVNIDGEHAIDFMVINKVYGGNDIAGTIGTSTVPSELTEVIPEPTEAELAATATEPEKTRDEWRADYKTEHPEKNDVDDSWNSYVRISSKMDPDVCYTQKECDDHNADLTGAISTSTSLTPEQASTLNGLTGVSKTDYAVDDKPSAEDAKLYNAQLAGAWTTNDIKTHTKVASDNEKVYIGQLFAGGNGDYTRRSPGEDNKNTYRIYDKSVTDYENANPIAERTMDFAPPALDKTYLEIMGGSIVYAYGGGNNATVRENTIIYYNNPSEVVNEIWVKNGDEVAAGTEGATNLLSNDRFKNKMGINTGFSHPSSADFQVGRFFGGNNRAEMAIMPTWNLQRGLIRNLYSGGNQGAMTNSIGLLLEIDPLPDYEGKTEHLVIDNVYGGCRMADVRPLLSGTISSGTFIESQSGDITLKERFKEEDGTPKYYFPDGLAARVLIKGGHINNVYGGNDVTGTVFGGNAIGINTTIYGDIYGGGNGSYPYTDNASMLGNDIYGDLYYGDPENPYANGFQSIEALNDFRPNAEQVSIHLTGKYERDATGKVKESTIVPTIIYGSVYCGGNSATLKSTKAEPIVELKFGSYVIADKVFLGNNGENMVATTPEVKDNDIITRHGGVLWSYKNKDGFTKIDLDEEEKDESTGKTQMDLYMEGVSMHMTPSVVFDQKGTGNTIKDRDDYVEYSSYVGSFFCGGNIGSIDIAGKIPINFNHNLIIYDKVVGGCNNSNVPTLYAADDPQKSKPLNVPYEGGILGTTATTNDPNNKVKIELNFEGLKMQPKRWDATYTAYTGEKLVIGNTYYTSGLGDGEFVAESETKEEGKTYYEMTAPGTELVWNTIKKISHVDEIPQRVEFDNEVWDGDNSTINRRLLGGNIYGGCYNSGHVEGDVVINLNSALVDLSGEHAVFDEYTEKTTNGKPWKLYDYDKPSDYSFTQRHSHVLLPEQGMEVFGLALNVYGGGKGKDTEIWGSSYINLLKGYTFQIFGGSQEGVIGKGTPVEDDYVAQAGEYVTNGKKYTYNADYSTYINMSGEIAGVSTTESNAVLSSDDAEEKAQMKNLAEALFIYGGGYEGLVAGDTHINLGNGRVFNTFAGSCNADLLGHTETYIGRQWDNQEKTYTDGGGFPWVTDHVYGGNDLGGAIKGTVNMSGRVSEDIKSMVYNADVTKASSYVEYLQGRVENIFGGAYGDYDYEHDDAYKIGTDKQPRLDNAFINFKPLTHANNYVEKLFGAGQGQTRQPDKDKMQNRSYLLIDIPQTVTKFQDLEVFGAGAFGGVGIDVAELKPKTQDTNETDETFAARVGIDYTQPAPDNYVALADKASAVIDLMRGQIKAVYGGSYEEGITRRTVINVPEESTIKIKDIFGGAYGTEILPPCDVYEANVNYRNTSELARVTGAIYGGNNNVRRTLYGKVNIYSPVWSDKESGYLAYVYGAGRGLETWSEYTEVNLEDGAKVWEAYGGGELGHVLNAESVQKYMQMYKDHPSADIAEKDPIWNDSERWTKTTENGVNTYTLKDGWSDDWINDWKAAWSLGDYYASQGDFIRYIDNPAMNLSNKVLVKQAEIDDREGIGSDPNHKLHKRYNANVRIKKGATIGNYAYGGGWGTSKTPLSGDVYGTTYIALLGGTVTKDMYAAGTSGAVYDLFGAGNFIASSTSYVEGGTCRNVYGGGWEGSVGYHAGALSASPLDDTLGETHVVIGIRPDTGINFNNTDLFPDGYSFLKGIPAIQRNAYGGGEGGAVYGTTHMTLNNGYIGYEHFNAVPTTHTDLTYIQNGTDYYQEKIHDETHTDETHPEGSDNFRLEDCGNVYGGGYDDNSNVDESIVTIYGGVIRNSLYGGGEIATIGRGSTMEEGAKRTLQAIYKAGKTQVELFNGKVLHDVFGGGKGFNLLGYGHSSDKERLYTDGYVFGQTEVHIHGGEVGTAAGVASGLGNVFGGGNVGFVYSPGYFNEYTKRDNTNSTGSPDHYYYYEQDYKCTAAPTTGKYKDKYKKDDIIDEITYKALYDSNEDIGTWEIQSKKLAETCKVVVSPYLQVKAGVTPFTFEGKTYGPYDYVPTDYLNTLPKKDNTNGWSDEWNNLVVEDADETERGILIHNAVFAGGNVSSNNDQTYANATTVFGNTTATLYDVYHRDFITVGTEHTGGLYGGGNLSMVDGYRELNITNYGTDYYSLEQTITIDQYHDLSNRERAYFKLKYELKATTTFTKEGLESKTYSIEQADQKLIEEEEYLKLVEQYGDQVVNAFTPYGECSIYAGRLLNTIQRADFCGVYGSRLVLQGAKDRVTDVAVTDVYTINRVGELSLNQEASVADDTGEDASHGNYFGIYSVVNYLGNLTSDVRFSDNFRNGNGEEVTAWFNSEGVVVENPTEQQKENGEVEEKKYTYYTYKSTKPTSNKRNHGKSVNQVALASGVFLELTTEHSTEEKKDYGYITGVIELDLINVKKDNVGGGFVYAKNEHRVPKYYPNKENVLLSEYNKEKKVGNDEIRDEARTYKRYRYATPAQEIADGLTYHDPKWADELWPETSTSIEDKPFVISGDDAHVYKTMSYQTSGNFIHHSKTIVDDCYPTNNAYIIGSENYSPAHYWYVKGTVYIYDQTVSAYTGSANAYSKEVRLPLTITAASHGQLQLLNVKPNLYAYKMPGTNGINVKIGSENDTNGKPIDKVWVNNDADNYQLNDVITWWDWHQLSPTERAYFVTETFVNCVACKIDGTEYAAGEYVMDNTDYNTFKTGTHTVTDLKGEAFANDFEVFRSSNNISHDTGYVLTFDMSSPSIWDDYYTKVNDNTQKISKAQYEDMLANAADDAAKQAIYDTWIEGPSFTPKETGVYGKREFKEGAIITQNTFDSNSESTATFEPAYIAKETVTYTHTYQEPSETDPTTMETKTVQKTVNPGTAIPASEYTEVSDPDKAAFTSSADLYVCTTPYSYTVGEGNEAQTINVAEGTVINQADYNQLTSEQKGKYAQGAYVCFNKVVIGETTYKPGTVIAASTFNNLSTTNKEAFTNNCTMVCNKTVELAKGVYLVYGELKTLDEISALKVQYPTLASKIDEAMTPAYICSKGGEYGGQQYYKGHNYSAIQGWSSLSTTDRIANDGSYKFDYNYDALDLLTDKAYLVVNGIETPDHDITVDAFHSPYTDQVGVEYQAVFKKAGVDVEVDGSNLVDGEVITKDKFESLRNDQLHYTRVDVTSNNPTVYFATSNFTYKGVPYGKGQEIDEDIYLANADEAKSKVEAVTFNNVISGNPYYYCYEDYSSVEKGTLKTKDEFDALTNYQKYFIIQGQEPTERTTLYVSRESDYYDVLKEKVVTVVYQYTYYEEEDNGNIKQTNELHVVNVHLQLESGSPSIGLLNPLATVLPGWTVGMRAPDVSPGLYEVLENGWELYTTKDDADNHRNGIPFDSKTPVYWYQNGDNYIAFYSKTYLGKTYSPNYVPLSVANYHDLDEVMLDKKHHMYVDRSDVDRASKIYINNITCKSDPDKSELDLLRDFFDLSLQTEVVTTEGAATKDHATLDSHVRGGEDLVFILNGDISPKKYVTHYTTTDPVTGKVTEHDDGPGWTPIGDDTQCFAGTFHGDGYTISGLEPATVTTGSLFGNLCGDVYNLGVTGSFTGAGVADTGKGYVENCWISTTGTPNSSVHAVFGNPIRNNDPRGDLQVVNCYYPESNNGYNSDADGTHGNATKKPDKDFYNGTVAYDLNDFYLNKRYYHGINLSEDETKNYEYKYFDSKSTAEDKLTKGYYPLTHDAKIGDIGYVEKRYRDGDYRYAGGTIPESVDKRMTLETTTDNENNETTVPVFYPIWPDDYLFFGQTLNYGYGGTHQDNPGHISGSNRVYRAPAYYGNSTMSVVHFNPDAVLAAKSNDGTKDAYPGMTAIDFKGHEEANNPYVQGLVAATTSSPERFYPPLLDDDGLTSIANHGETQNLVVYAPSAEQNAKTLGVLTNYFKDPALSDYDETSDKYTDGKKYGRVAIAHAGSVLGHLVQSDLTATNDHFLVDKQDFNAPISYQFDTDHLMWYQRIPSNYVSIDWTEDATPVRSTKGWVGISLPFKADLVTTQTKGEITHFYEGNTTGHEYWLREFTGVDGYTDATEQELKATMEYLKKESGNTKEYTNNFLWDYYYRENTHIDKNTDEYQTYYNKSHTYLGYPSLAATKPYIIGFPGQQYYEFDLSGNWAPKNTSDDSKWNATTETAQTISFVSKKGITVGKSDQDMTTGKVTWKNVTFMPNYMNTTFTANTAATYTPSIEGSSYDLVPATPVTVPAFRPYFTGSYTASSPAPRRIVFSGGSKTSLEPDVTEHNDGDGGLHISTDKKTIVVRSTLRDNATVRITTAAGIDVATFTIEPGQTVKTPVPMTGVYMVNQKKILVK